MPEEKELLLKINGLSIVFGGLRAVSDFSCDLYRGELLGLIGPNGAGKTTVFNMVSGIYTPTEGEITFWDRHSRSHNIGKIRPSALNRIGIARTFQNIRLFGNLTVEDNVRLLNSVNPNHETLRNSMIPTLLCFVRENRAFAEDFGLFEIGRVVNGLDANGDCDERKRLGLVLCSRTSGEEELFFQSSPLHPCGNAAA